MSYAQRLQAEIAGKRATSAPAKTDKTPSVSYVSASSGALSPEMVSLIERVGAYFQTSPADLALALEVAARDPKAARESFEDNKRLGWIV